MGLIGQALTRREDPPLLTGRGVTSTTSRRLAHCTHTSSAAPWRTRAITGIDVTEAREAEGVAAVFTAADLAELGVGPLPGAEGLPPGAQNPAYPVLAGGAVLWAGQPVVLVIADTPERAADAAELVDVDYDELPAVTGVLDAAAPAAPLVHAGAASNIAFRKRLTAGDADGAFARAAYRVRQRMTSQRIAPVALEPRGVLAYPAEDGRLEVRLPTQRPHGARNWLAKILGVPVSGIHVIAGDVGGGVRREGPHLPRPGRGDRRRPGAAPPGEVDRGTSRSPSPPPRTAVTRWPTWSSPRTPTGSSPRCAAPCTPASALTSRRTPPAHCSAASARCSRRATASSTSTSN